MKYTTSLAALIALSVLTESPTAATRARLQRPAQAASQIQNLEFERASDRSIRVDGVLVEGRAYTLEMWPHSLRTADFHAYLADGTMLYEYAAPEPRTYRGWLMDDSGNIHPAAGSFDGADKLRGVFLVDGRAFAIQPAGAGRAGDHRIRAVAESLAELSIPMTCGTENSPDADWIPPSHTGIEEAGVLKSCRIALDSDFELFQDLGNGPIPGFPDPCDGIATTEDCAIHHMETVMAEVSLIYENFVQINYEVTTVIVRPTAGGPYTSTDPQNLLDQFRIHWNANMQLVDRQVAHLFTGKNLVGNVIGIANRPGVCVVFPFGIGRMDYGLSQTLFDPLFEFTFALTAHELGHNWDAIHCDAEPLCDIMCSFIGGCNAHIDQFEPFSVNRIVNYRDSVSGCIPAFGGEIELNPYFSDRFIQFTDFARWSYFQGAVVAPTAVNTPDLGSSMRLRPLGNAEHQDPELRSNELDMTTAPGAASFTISYFTEHRGVESGEKLIVEYFSDDFVWRPLNEIVSNGIDQTAFDFHVHPMPADGLHSRFRLRFRGEVGDSGTQNDDWFIDMVRVGKFSIGTLLTAPRLTMTHPFPPLVPGPIAITGAGDRNGDGRDDFLAGYPEQNQVVLFSGLDGAFISVMNAGGPTSQRWGSSLATLVVGGGCKDNLVGGPGDATTLGAVQRDCGPDAFGSFAGDQFGWSVAALSADLNADGVKDFVVGAPAQFGGIGYVRVLSGANSSLIYQFNGSFAGDGFGFSVDGVDDVNGDGVIDIVVGVPFANLGEAGAVKIFSGSNGALLRTENGAIVGQHLGWSVSGLGDINQDGRAEFIASAPTRSTSMGVSTGAVYVFDGQTSGLVRYEFLGSFDRDHFGWSVDGIRDINRDGKNDILVGAPGGDPTSTIDGVSPGTAHIYSGANGTELWSFQGEAVGEFFGAGVAYGGRMQTKGDLQVVLAAFEHGADDTAKTYVFRIPNSNPNIQQP